MEHHDPHPEGAYLEPPLPHGGALPPALLRSPPLAWLVAHHAFSQLGFWAFFVALVAQASYSFRAGPFELGILFSSFSVAFLLFTAPFGMVVDRWSPKLFTAIAQLLSIGAALLALSADSLEWLYLASALDGVGAAAHIPARGAITGLLVNEADLVRANGMLNSASMFGVIFGPGAGGLLAKHVGQRAVYWYVAAALLVGVVLLLPVPDVRPRKPHAYRFLRDLAEGFTVSWREPELRALLFLGGSAWFLLTVLITLEPLFVRQVLGRGVDGLGFLWSAHGVGAFLGALAVTRSKRAVGREVTYIGLSLVVSGLGFLLYVSTSSFGVAVAGTAILGVGFAWLLSLNQALVQRVAQEHLRGRVTGVVGMLEETTALACSLGIAVLGGLVLVQPYLVGAALALAASGLYGLRAGRRLSLLSTVRDER